MISEWEGRRQFEFWQTYLFGDLGGLPGSYLAGLRYMSGSTGESFMFLPAISGLIRPRVVILKSVLLELGDLPEQVLEAVDGRFVVSWENANDRGLGLADWGTPGIEHSNCGTGGNVLLMLTGDFVRAPPTLSLTPSVNRLSERMFDVCSLTKVMSFEGADCAVIVLIVDRKVTESLLEEGYCCFGYSNPVVPCFDLP
jgi:hypothetical protein